ncbi:hypothetical protein [Rossellomorea marisflavi]|uniref:hypothetical protein n=1 Tax=Rossellomorea marisflavi TaxID=189381 RepID=UPI00345ACF35
MGVRGEWVVPFRCGHPLSMGRAVSRFGKPAGSHPARFSHRSRVAFAALHFVRIDER